jgi:hypothetical protein
MQQNMSSYIEYADLTNQLDDLGVYIGGTGTRIKKSDSTGDEYYTYQGMYNYYLNAIQTLEPYITYDESETHIPLVDTLSRLQERKSA